MPRVKGLTGAHTHAAVDKNDVPSHTPQGKGLILVFNKQLSDFYQTTL